MLMQIFQRLAVLVSLALLALAAYLLWSWNELREAAEAGLVTDRDDWRLWVGLALGAASFLGKFPLVWLTARRGVDRARLERAPGGGVETPDGARLYVEDHGPRDAPALVFVHGWGLDAGVWWDARQRLAHRYRVIAYDLAGLGRSSPPRDGRLSVEGMADHLMAVLEATAPRQAILVGHSIGGMILQTFAARHAGVMGGQVVGLALENTTYTDPTKTTVLGGALYAMQPLLRPIMRLDVVLSPLVKLMNWQSYLSGWTHLAMRLGGFGARPTIAQLEQVSLAATRNSPAVQAKGNLAMMDWAGADPRRLRVPTLVFIGGRDLVTVPEAGETIAFEGASARPHRVPRAGHLGPMELADEYNAALEAFADATFTRGAAWADRAISSGSPPAAPEIDRTRTTGRDRPNGLGPA